MKTKRWARRKLSSSPITAGVPTPNRYFSRLNGNNRGFRCASRNWTSQVIPPKREETAVRQPKARDGRVGKNSVVRTCAGLITTGPNTVARTARRVFEVRESVKGLSFFFSSSHFSILLFGSNLNNLPRVPAKLGREMVVCHTIIRLCLALCTRWACSSCLLWSL